MNETMNTQNAETRLDIHALLATGRLKKVIEKELSKLHTFGGNNPDPRLNSDLGIDILLDILHKYLKPAIDLNKYKLVKIGWADAIDTVVQQLEKPTYTPADMDSFAEWCRIEGFFYEVDNKIWCNYDTEPITEKTTTQLREDWEAKQKGEVADIPVKQKCPKCGDESYNSNVNYCLNSNCSLPFI